MRDILFRAKRLTDQKWTYGDFTEVVGDCPRILSNENATMYAVDPETVGQYTGLTDKNGKKIFEGDIVRLTDEHNEMEWTAVVAFGNPNGDYNWGWQLNAIEEFDGNKDILLWADMEESGAYCEVIGKIHDNPELMKRGE